MVLAATAKISLANVKRWPNFFHVEIEDFTDFSDVATHTSILYKVVPPSYKLVYKLH